jgi:hypothetical protein
MIIGLLYEHRRRRNAEIETRQRMSELAHLNRQATGCTVGIDWHELNQPLGDLNNANKAQNPELTVTRLEEVKTISMRSGATTSGRPKLYGGCAACLGSLQSRRRISISMKQFARCLNFFRRRPLRAMSR